MVLDSQGQTELEVLMGLLLKLEYSDEPNTKRQLHSKMEKEYKKNYEDQHLDKILDLNLRFLILDAQMNFEPIFVNKIIQMICNEEQDGFLDKQTLKTINESDSKMIQQNLISELLDHIAFTSDDRLRDYEEKRIKTIENILQKEILYVKGFDCRSKKFIIGSDEDIPISDVATVLSVYYNPGIPEKFKQIRFSLDPVITKEQSIVEQTKAFWPDEYLNKTIIGDTEFANVLFESDVQLKYMTLGVEKDGQTPLQFPEELVQKGMQSWLNLDGSTSEKGETMCRFWLSPDSCSYASNKDVFIVNSVEVICQARQIEVINNNVRDKINQNKNDRTYLFAQKFTQNYDVTAKYFPIFSRLKKLFKAVALGKKMYENKIQIDFKSLSCYQRKFDNSPKTIPLIKHVNFQKLKTVQVPYSREQKKKDMNDFMASLNLPISEQLVESLIQGFPDVIEMEQQIGQYVEGGINPNCNKMVQQILNLTQAQQQRVVNIPFCNQQKCKQDKCGRFIEQFLADRNQLNCSIHNKATCVLCFEIMDLQRNSNISQKEIQGISEKSQVVAQNSHKICNQKYQQSLQTQQAQNHFETIFPLIKKVEGGLSNHKNDKGGLTQCGVTQPDYNYTCSLRKIQPKDSVELLTDQEIKDHYAFQYHHYLFDKIQNKGVQTIMYDSFVNQGYGGMRTCVRRALGNIGLIDKKQLIIKVNNYPDQEKLKTQILKERLYRYFKKCRKDTTQTDFEKGWGNRLIIVGNQTLEEQNARKFQIYVKAKSTKEELQKRYEEEKEKEKEEKKKSKK